MGKGFFVFFFGVFFVLESLALKEIHIRNHHQTTLEISKSHPNRFAIKGDRIKELIGGEDSLIIESEEETGQVFLKPKNPQALNPIYITILTENGLTHDLELIPQDKKGESILFYEKAGSQEEKGTSREIEIEEESQKQASLNPREILFFLKQIILEMRGEKGNIHKEPLLKSDRLFKVKDEGERFLLEVTPMALYKERFLEGHVLSLINKGEKPFVLKEKDMTLPGDLGVMLLKNILSPQESTLLFIVKKGDIKTLLKETSQERKGEHESKISFP